MANKRAYNLYYKTLRIFHWSLFIIVVEFIFCCAWWMIFGLIGSFFDWALIPTRQTNTQGFMYSFANAGKYFGLIAGIFFTRFVMGRYFNSGRN
jgi:hypothetical protein